MHQSASVAALDLPCGIWSRRMSRMRNHGEAEVIREKGGYMIRGGDTEIVGRWRGRKHKGFTRPGDP